MRTTLIVVSGLSLSLLAGCRSALYYPTDGPTAVEGWESEQVMVDHWVTVNGLVRATPDAQSRWLLFFGGNAMSIASSSSVLEELAGSDRWGLAVFAYRGYDGSGGQPSESALVEDGYSVAGYLQERYGVGSDRLVLVGQSLGTGIAASLAARLSRQGTPPAGLVLLSPYTSMVEVFGDHAGALGKIAAADRYDTAALVPEIPGPVLILHGDADRVIPVAHGRRLAAAFGERATYVELAGRGHNELWSEPRVLEQIRAFVRR